MHQLVLLVLAARPAPEVVQLGALEGGSPTAPNQAFKAGDRAIDLGTFPRANGAPWKCNFADRSNCNVTLRLYGSREGLISHIEESEDSLAPHAGAN